LRTGNNALAVGGTVSILESPLICTSPTRTILWNCKARASLSFQMHTYSLYPSRAYCYGGILQASWLENVFQDVGKGFPFVRFTDNVFTTRLGSSREGSWMVLQICAAASKTGIVIVGSKFAPAFCCGKNCPMFIGNAGSVQLSPLDAAPWQQWCASPKREAVTRL